MAHLPLNKRLLTCCLVMVTALANPILAWAEPLPLNGIAAMVNEKIITWREVQQPALIQYQLRNPNGRIQDGPEWQQILQDTRERLIETELILNEFETAGFQFPETYINKEVQRRIKEDFGDRVNMMKTLRAEGKNFEEFKDEVRNDIIIGAMKNHYVSSSVIVSPYKIEKYYEENQDEFRVEDQINLSMIFLANSLMRPASATLNLAEEIQKRLIHGVEFSEMASIYNDSTTYRNAGGRCGWQLTDFLPEDIRDTVLAMEPGQLSEPLLSATGNYGGVYLILLNEKRDAHVSPLKDVRIQIEDTLYLQVRKRLEDEWIKGLRAKSLVRYFPMR